MKHATLIAGARSLAVAGLLLVGTAGVASAAATSPTRAAPSSTSSGRARSVSLSSLQFNRADLSSTAGISPVAAATQSAGPLVWFGETCNDVSAGPDSGQICIVINQSNVTGAVQALVRFNSYSGSLFNVSVNDLVLNRNGKVVKSTGPTGGPPNNGTNGYISTGWYYPLVSAYFWSDVEDPCMIWPNGLSGCIDGWFQSNTVLIYGPV